MAISIEPARSAQDYASFATLIEEYVGWCRTRFADDPWFVDMVFGHQALDSELAALSRAYGPPQGLTLLARVDGEVRGAGAYRWIGEGVCEMKRLYVPVRFQGMGLGRRLADALMIAAQAEGCRLMRLDSGKRHHEAIALYEALGFKPCPPYHDYPAALMPHLVFMERGLTGD
jgi:ribosomal protein S18 acetylase RimI-like enzyme